jgi:hypothetical protein
MMIKIAYNKFLVLLLLFLSLSLSITILPRAALAGDSKQQISVYESLFTDKNGDEMIRAIFPLPPPTMRMMAASAPDIQLAGTTVTLSNVPAFYWSYGCSTTSAAMLFGYYDRIGYSNMYAGPSNGGICPLDNTVWGTTTYSSVTCGECPLSVSHNGIDGYTTKGHVDDYWVDYLNTGDPFSGTWAEHTIGSCTGDYMGTNQWKYGSPINCNQDGSTTFFLKSSGDPTYDSDLVSIEPTYRDGCHGMKLFAESRGYTVITNYNQLIKGQGTDPNKGFTFDDFQSEINAGRPVMINLVGHSMLGYGYNTADNTIYVHDTWDYTSHTMTWGGTYNGLQQRSVSVIQLQPIPPTVTNSTGASNVMSTGSRLNGELTGTGGENPTVYVYWGTTDGGTAPANWANHYDLGISSMGTFNADITGLLPGTTYYYRSFAFNSAGGNWAGGTNSFATYPLPTMESLNESQGSYFSTSPILSKITFHDANGLNDGWYQLDSYSGSWTVLFTNNSGTLWSSDNWTIPGFSGLGQGSHTVYFKASNDYSGQEGESGEWSWQFYKDTIGPESPANLISPSHTASVWSNNNTVTARWTPSVDATSGLDGYSILWNSSPSTNPDTEKDLDNTVTTAVSPVLADGNSYYFHIRAVDRMGNWGPSVHIGPFYVETVSPTGPTNVTGSIPINTWSNQNTIQLNWTAAVDVTSGLDGYAVVWNTSPDTIPPDIKSLGNSATSGISPALNDGINHYFHIKAKDKAGNWGPSLHIGPFWIDSSAPSGPTSLSGSINPNSWSNNNTIAVNWVAAIDNASGLKGYSILWDTSAATDPDTTLDIDAGTLNNVSPSLPDNDSYYFHIRPIDNSENYGPSVHIGPFRIDTVNPATVTNIASTTHTPGIWSNMPSVSLSWTAAVDSGSGIAGYAILWDTSTFTVPNPVKSVGNVSSITSPILTDNTNCYCHIRSVDLAGNWGSTANIGPFEIDTTPPTGPSNLTSSSHQTGVWSNNNTITVNWTPAVDPFSGLSGYSISWDLSPTTDPPSAINAGPLISSSSTELADGSGHYFHIKALDIAGNWTPVVHLGPFMISKNSAVLSGGSVSPMSGYQTDTYSFTVNYRHPLGLSPASISVSIDNQSPVQMTIGIQQDDNFTEDRIFVYSTTGNSLAIGNHTFNFAGTDNLSHPAVGDTGVHNGPVISTQVIQTPVTGGGFGGGFIGGGGGGVASGPGVTSLSPYTSYDGHFNLDAVAMSDDQKVSLDIVKGVFAQNKDSSALKSIKIVPIDSPLSAPEGYRIIGLVYECTPEGATFSPAINITFAYDLAGLPTDITPGNLSLAYYNPTTSAWELISSVPNTVDSSVTADISHFSIYTILGKETVKVAPTTTPTPAPASFTISDISVNPASCLSDETVTITVRIGNTGGSTGNYTATLKINGSIEATKQLFISPGTSQTATFDIQRHDPGNYTVEVNSLTANFTVRQPQPTFTPILEQQTTTPIASVKGGINWTVILAIAGGVIIIFIMITLIYIWQKKR